ncbi:hypothetical protein ACQ4P5_14260 [Ralstonia sp. L16]|uniref:hypothetical protein n=1 Tax=Ralstonia sp. L16 TaxID=3423950 RepID=UPI003F7A8761
MSELTGEGEAVAQADNRKEVIVSEVLGRMDSLLRRAMLDLVDKSLDRTVQMIHLPDNPRADGAGYVRLLEVDRAVLTEYVKKLFEIEKYLRNIRWSDLGVPKPEVVADLRYLMVNGDAGFPADFPIRLERSVVTGRLLINAHAGCHRIDVSEAGIAELEIHLANIQRDDDGEIDIRARGNGIRSLSIRGMGRTSAARLDVTNGRFQRFTVDTVRVADLHADGTHFDLQPTFHGCQIAQARFVDCNFKNGWEFFHCRFISVPSFSESKMERQNTRFVSCRFVPAGSIFGQVCASEDIARYRYLRGHFSKSKDIYHENIFYALEQRAQRLNGGSSWFDRSLSFAYDVLADYGNSVGRPLGIFAAQIVVFALLFSGLGGVTGKGVFTEYPGLGLSLQNSFNPISLFSEKVIVSPDTFVVYGLALLQAILSVTTIALTLIGIRGRFKKGGGGESS